MPKDAVMTPRALGRATLRRQMLDRRVDMSVPDALEHLVGMQAQEPNAPYVGLWTRLESFAPEDLSRMIEGRAAVRIALMRSTLHLVTARDCLALRPVMQPALERGIRSGRFAEAIGDIDVDELTAYARSFIEDMPRAPIELTRSFAERWPGRDGHTLMLAVRALLPLVQVPPRGLWRARGRPVVTTAESWLGRPLDQEASPDAVVLRYLGAFGPASLADIARWSGLSGLRPAVERVRERLRTFRTEDGKELLDVEDGPTPDPDSVVPPRFLPQWDNVLFSQADRTRIIPAELHNFILRNMGRPTVLVDGSVAAFWKVARTRDAAALRIEPFVQLTAHDRDEIVDEGTKLLAFLEPGRDRRVVEFADRQA